MSKIICVIFTCALLLACAACGGGTSAPAAQSPPPAEIKQIKFATSTPQGANYPIGGGLSAVLNNTLKGSNFTVEATGGAIENMRLINAKNAQLGTTSSDVLVDAYEGINSFAKDGKLKVASLGYIYSTPMQIVTLKSLNIKTVADLEGKRIAIGMPGAHTNTKAYLFCKQFGYEDGKNITFEYLDSAEGCEGLINGTIDAVFAGVAIPAANITELALSHEIELVTMPEAECDALCAAVAYFSPSVVPGDTYKGISQNVLTFAYNTEIAIDPGLDNDFVYSIAKTLFGDEFEKTKQVHSVLAKLEQNEIPKTVIPLHPGAEKYYKEAGFMK